LACHGFSSDVRYVVDGALVPRNVGHAAISTSP
jgi:hypothetical protein